MSGILEGARKYGLGLTLAHQNLSQVANQEIVESAIANAHTRVCFRLGDRDASSLARGFSFFGAEHLQNLERGHAICRIGRSGNDFNLESEVLRNVVEGRREELVEAARSRFTVDPAEAASPVRQPEPPGTSKPLETRKAPPTPSKLKQPAPKEENNQGRGGPEHRYLQEFVRRLAQDRGYRATIEESLPNGGRVDVGLDRDGTRLAIEISVTTGLEHEAANVAKCLDAGFESVLVVSTEARAARALSSKLAQSFAEKEARVVRPQELPDVLSARKKTESVPTTVRGYRVRVEGSRTERTPAVAVAKTLASAIRRRRHDDT